MLNEEWKVHLIQLSLLFADTVNCNSSIMASEEADVLLVGGGPVGLTIAAELSYRGIKTILIEKKLTTTARAKAFQITARSMEQYRRLGLQAHIEEVSYPRDQKVYFAIATSATGPMICKQAL